MGVAPLFAPSPHKWLGQEGRGPTGRSVETVGRSEAPPLALSANQLFLPPPPPQIVEEIRQVQEGKQGSDQKEAGLQKEMQIQALEMEKLSSNLALLKKSLDGFQVSPLPPSPPQNTCPAEPGEGGALFCPGAQMRPHSPFCPLQEAGF